jgi:hypothetical protein
MTAQPMGGSSKQTVIAPAAPGRLGAAASMPALAEYLMALGEWVEGRRRELDRLDTASLHADDPDSYAGDVTLSMALWQSVNARQHALLGLWDSGRADLVAREKMSVLIWGRQDSAGAGGGSGMALSLVEACRLSDALATQLRTRLAFDPSASDAPARVSALRSAMERLRELVRQEPTWAPQVENLQLRIDGVATRAARGVDVSEVLTELEADAARGERDLIVRTASRRQAARDAAGAVLKLEEDRRGAFARLDALRAREVRIRALVTRCVAEIAGAPRLAVPEPDVLGQVPAERAALDAYLARMSAVDRAFDVAERAYGSPLAERDELRGRLGPYQVMALRNGRDRASEVIAALARVQAALDAVPCDVRAAATALEEYTRLIRPAGAPGPNLRQERR